MDPASAVITFVTAGLQVTKLIRDVVVDIRNAPEELQRVQDRVLVTEAGLRILQGLQPEDVADEDMELLQRVDVRAQACLRGVEGFVSQVRRVGKGGNASVKKIKWLMQRGRLEELLRQLDALDSAVNMVLNV